MALPAEEVRGFKNNELISADLVLEIPFDLDEQGTTERSALIA